jgi:two-component system sensor histidine kinase KdpD
VDERPNPEQLLKQVQAQEADSHRGKLKLFFGANAGVGKTYAMLEAARARKKEGVDVIVGVVETHGRSETAALLEGLEILPKKDIVYKNVKLKEFDIDGALARRPALILVDELAHTNAPGSRHDKRWQDIEELLDAGISVYTTLNVQHWESLNDVVAQVTGVVVRETVPDSFLQRTHDLELVDISPDDLLKRLKEGKVYMGEQAERAAQNFFKPENLTALRELTMRHAAERLVDEGISRVRERLLVSVTGSPMSPRLVRATARLASSLKAEWLAVHVETPHSVQQSAEDRDRLFRTFKLAEQLGGEAFTLSGQRVVPEIIRFAHSRNVTKIILGKPARSRWREWIFGSVVNDMARQGGDIDLYIISGEGRDFSSRRVPETKKTLPWGEIGIAAGVMALCTLINWPLSHLFDRVNLVMIYLLGILWTAYRLGRLPAMAASFIGVLAFDFFFVPPTLTFAVSDTQYIFTFIVMLIVGLSISTLAGRLSQQTEALRRRVRRTRLLYQFSRMLSETPDPKELVQKAWKHLTEFYQLPVLIFLPQHNKELQVVAGDSTAFGVTHESMGAVEWVMLRNEAAGTGTDTLASLGALYLPLKGLQEPVGVLAIKPPDSSFFQDPEQFQLLETLAGEFGGALESTQMSEAAGRSEAEIETQRLRNLLLTSLSYDLRDPLRRLSRRVHELLDPASPLTDKSREALMKEIKDESDRLEKMSGDLLTVIDTEIASPPTEKS